VQRNVLRVEGEKLPWSAPEGAFCSDERRNQKYRKISSRDETKNCMVKIRIGLESENRKKTFPKAGNVRKKETRGSLEKGETR